MKRYSSIVAGLVLVLIMAAAEDGQAEEAWQHWVTRAGQEERILSLVAPTVTEAAILPGAWLDRIEIREEAILFVVSGHDPDGSEVALVLTWESPTLEAASAPPWLLKIAGDPATEVVGEAVSLLRGRIEGRLTPEIHAGIVYRRTGEEPGATEVLTTWTGRLRWYRDRASWRATLAQPFTDVPWETFLAGIFMIAALGFAAYALRDLLALRRAPEAHRFLLEAAAIALISLGVRVLMTTPNLLTAEAEGTARILRYGGGWSGLSLFIRWVLPGGAGGATWPVIQIVTVLSASGPPLLVALARAAGLPRRAGLLAGFAMATWPLHAAISASEMFAGPTMAITMGGLTLAFVALREDRPPLALAAAAILAWVVWCRPDGALVILPAVVPGVLAARRWSHRIEVRAAAAWLGLALFCRAVGFLVSGPIPAGPWGTGGIELRVAAEALGGHPMAPWWLWLGVPLGLLGLWRRRNLAGVVGVGLAAAALSVVLQGTSGDPWFAPRSGVMGMPWLVLLSGAGFAALLDRIPKPRLADTLFVLLAAGILVVPTVHREWLGTRYSPATSDLAFRRAHRDMHPDCGVVVPGEVDPKGHETAARYQQIAWEESRHVPETPLGYRVVAASEFRARVRDGTSLPAAPTATAWATAGQGCWFAFTQGDPAAPAGLENVPLAKYCDDCMLSWVRLVDDGEEPPHPGTWDLPCDGVAPSGAAPLPSWALPEVISMSEMQPGYEELQQTGWWQVRFYGPGPWPLWLVLLIQLALGVTFLAAWRGRRSPSGGLLATPRLFAPAIVLLAGAATAFLWWWLGSGLPEATWDRFLVQLYGDPNAVFVVREFAVVATLLGAAVVGVGAATVVGIQRILRPGPRRAGLETLGLAVLVLVVSLVIRLGFTVPNILTDGGSGHERVLLYGPNYGGLSVLVSWLLPGNLAGRVWPGIRILTILSGLAPVSLLLLALGAGLGRGVALLSALALACWPLHAALYASDFLNGGILTLTLTALAFGVGALRLDRPWLLLPGAAILGFAIWCRPEAPVHLLPAVVPGLLAVRRWGHRAEVWVSIAWVAVALAGLLLSMTLRPEFYRPTRQIAGFAEVSWEAVTLAGFTALPWWLPLGIPFGAALAPRALWVSLLILAGLVAGWAPAFIGGMPEDLLEGFRYGTLVAPWLALLSGAGLHWLVTRIPPGRRRAGALGLVIAAVCVTPLLHLDYLGTAYGTRVSDFAFRRALRQIPGRCGVIVPGERREDGLDPAWRFVYIAAEEWKIDPSLPAAQHVVGAGRFLDTIKEGGSIPRVTDFDESSEGPGDDSCWYVFLSGECLATQGMDSDPTRFFDPGTCKELEAALDLEPLETLARGFRYHRLVAVPGVRTPPLHSPDFEVRLLRLRGLKGVDDAP
ncbi:MAG: hypothetical protein ABIK09_03295 [Pseudomonadota bacterium]